MKPNEKTVIKVEKQEIYIGPTIKKYGLNSGSIFIGNLPLNVQEALEKFPAIKGLFVPINKNFSALKKNIKKEGTRENILYKKVLKELGGK